MNDNLFLAPLFYGFNEQEKDFLLAHFEIRIYPKGQVIIKEGEAGTEFFLILLGKIALTKKLEIEDHEISLSELGVGGVFGELSIISGSPRSATVMAKEETKVLVINYQILRQASTEIARQVYFKLMENLSIELSQKIYYQNDHLIRQKVEGIKKRKLKINPPSSILVMLGWKWKDIAREAVFLSQHGYDAIKISPPQEFVVKKNSPWWAVYQPVSYQLSNFYGTPQDFLEMVDFCHSYGLKIYVDLLLNYMAEFNPQDEKHQGTNDTNFSPYRYGPLNDDGDYFTYEDFYHYKQNSNCNVKDEDYQTFEGIWHLEHYDLLNLPKLNLGRKHVKTVLKKYIKKLLAMGVDGFRIDAAKHVNVKVVEELFCNLETTDGHRPYLYQEYYTGAPMGMNLYGFMEKYFRLGSVTTFKYGEFLADAITGKNNSLQTLIEYSFGSSWIHYPEDQAVTIIDNHDTERMMDNMLNFYAPHNFYVLAYVFMLAWPFGTPKIMSSFHFKHHDDPFPNTEVWIGDRNTCFDKGSPWVAQHRWNAIANMVLFHKLMDKASGIGNLWLNGNQVAFSRIEQYPKKALITRGFVIINATKEKLKRKFNTGLPDGEYYNLILSHLEVEKMEGPTVLVTDYGQATIEVPPYDAVVLSIAFLKS